VNPEAAVEAARRGLEALDLESHPGVASAMASADAGLPLRVERLDLPDRAYYLVPWIGSQGVELIVQVDVASGAMAGLVSLPRPAPRLALQPGEAERVVHERTGRRVLAEPRLVWLPCRESSSPFQPLYRVSTEGGDFFVGSDASFHSRLTPFGKGG
jgi:hypothetical protein